MRPAYVPWSSASCKVTVTVRWPTHPPFPRALDETLPRTVVENAMYDALALLFSSSPSARCVRALDDQFPKLPPSLATGRRRAVDAAFAEVHAARGLVHRSLIDTEGSLVRPPAGPAPPLSQRTVLLDEAHPGEATLETMSGGSTE